MNPEFAQHTAKAFAEWIGGCVPSKDRRSAYLDSLLLSVFERKTIEDLCDSVLKEADDYLWADKIPEWNTETEKALSDHFRVIAPWMEEDAMRALHRYVGWMGWHEGLIRQK